MKDLVASQSFININNYFNYNDCGSARRSVICDVCGEEGHDRSTCSYNSRKSTITCGNCGEEGHDRSTCSYNSRKSTITCGNCGEEGHDTVEVPVVTILESQQLLVEIVVEK
ncbi:15980_t:CDS:2, partial [Dentiscutata heterogama]